MILKKELLDVFLNQILSYNACRKLLAICKQKYINIVETESKFAWRRLESIPEQVVIINKYSGYIYEGYLDLLDGNIQGYIISDSEELFIIGYEIVKSKGMIE